MEDFIEYLDKRGNMTLLASELGITVGAIPQWKRIPAERVIDVERITGISRHKLRPDVFGDRPDKALA